VKVTDSPGKDRLSLSITLQLLRFWSIKRAGLYQPHLCLSRLSLLVFAQTQLPMPNTLTSARQTIKLSAQVSDAEASSRLLAICPIGGETSVVV